jgi:hypothetical protein
MPTRTRTAESKADETQADNVAEQAEPTDEAQQPSDGERALTEVERLRKELADSVGTVRANVERHNDLCKRLDAIAETLNGTAETPGVDLSEIHDRFDVLSAEIGGGMIRPEAVAESPVPAVLGQVLELMRAIREIGKGGIAPQQVGGYKFRRVDDAIDAVGNACRDVGLVLRSEVVRLDTAAPNGGMRTAHAIMRYTFVSTIDGTEHAIEGAGEGADKGDKSTSKACSMALKYALLQGLMIPVVGVHLDVEAEDTRPEPPQRQQRDERPRGQDRGGAPVRDQRDPNGSTGPAPQHDPSSDPPEVRAAEVLRRANDGRDAAAVKALMGKAGDAGLLGVEIESYGHSATLQQHLLAVIRLAEQAQRRGQQ